MRYFHPGRGQASDSRKCLKQLFQRQIFAAKEITLADFAFFGRQ